MMTASGRSFAAIRHPYHGSTTSTMHWRGSRGGPNLQKARALSSGARARLANESRDTGHGEPNGTENGGYSRVMLRVAH